MAESIAASSTIEIQHKPSLNKESLHDGQLKTKEKVFEIFMYEDTGAVTKRVSDFLGEVNMPLPDLPLDFQAVWVLPEELALCDDMETLLQELLELNGFGNKKEAKSEGTGTPLTFKFPSKKEDSSSPFFPVQQQAPSSTPRTTSYSSLFSLARALNQEKSAPLSQRLSPESSFQDRSSRLPVDAPRNLFGDSLNHLYQAENQERGDQQSRDQNSRDQQEQEKEEKRHKEQRTFDPESKNKKDKHFASLPTSCNLPMGEEKTLTQRLSFEASSSSGSVEKVQAPSPTSSQNQNKSSGNIFFRFMALMARILGQAEAEAHDLYLRIKERTDSIDVLTGLLSKINSSKGTMDIGKDEELAKLIDRARDLGVDIPKGKKTWNDDEKKLLKDNIHMRKDSMEKVTQLERTDMQRYLQEASQCHQARSNILKLHKEVMDTIIHNIRGG